ncbi:ORF19 [Leucania separata nucleopolyhedrovirus]|uniref:ORF19 n=1 Tax=Leucania separata nucleopolyhedrovirus TaxID=1307956 RepID=Q0ILA0_NPVLS|nr:ORF19 [Leucania separata nucleopolyhedrovirus]AAR28783.1 ORF19 [Leucania separata nucleopolyhedrovirus]
MLMSSRPRSSAIVMVICALLSIFKNQMNCYYYYISSKRSLSVAFGSIPFDSIRPDSSIRFVRGDGGWILTTFL